MPKHELGVPARPNQNISKTGVAAPSESVQDARRAAADEKIKVHVDRVVAACPALTADQRDRLALLLRGA